MNKYRVCVKIPAGEEEGICLDIEAKSAKTTSDGILNFYCYGEIVSSFKGWIYWVPVEMYTYSYKKSDEDAENE